MTTTGERGPSTSGVLVGLSDIYALVLSLTTEQSKMVGKLEAFISSANTTNEIHSRELRRVDEQHKREHDDHEHRLRQIELRAVVTPRTLVTTVGILIPLMGVIVAIISVVTR